MTISASKTIQDMKTHIFFRKSHVNFVTCQVTLSCETVSDHCEPRFKLRRWRSRWRIFQIQHRQHGLAGLAVYHVHQNHSERRNYILPVWVGVSLELWCDLFLPFPHITLRAAGIFACWYRINSCSCWFFMCASVCGKYFMHEHNASQRF